MAAKLKQKSEKVRQDWVQLDALACGMLVGSRGCSCN
jgi:hypothetical protein